jgi:hypothetical protein
VVRDRCRILPALEQMKIVRFVSIVAIVAVAAAAANRYCLHELQCERIKARIESISLRLWNISDDYARTARARENLYEISGCLRQESTDIDFLMLSAANLRMLGRSGEAALVYRRAARIEERPEIDFSLGETLLELNRVDDAVAAFTRAALFNSAVLADIGAGPVQERVRTIVTQHEERQRKGR